MLDPVSPLTALRSALASGTTSPPEIANCAAAKANSSASHNTYLYFDRAELLAQAEVLAQASPALPLYSVPISLKDCFDLAGTRTTCGSRFYAERNVIATVDSAVASNLRDAGCLVTGKTHMHSLAYGITGQNRDYGDALQPRDAALLTGGSSSGAAASVQEGSALAAIGTDTGGSIRVPAALCGLAGYRASLTLASASGWFPGAWSGAAHLAPSFDTVGFLLRDARDAAQIAHALFHIPVGSAPTRPRIGCVPVSALSDSSPDVLTAYALWKQRLSAGGAALQDFMIPDWGSAVEIFSGIQAHEAAQLHRGHYEEFEPAIAQRLAWGASITPAEVTALRARHTTFRQAIQALFAQFDFLMLPAAPVSRLRPADDQSEVRAAILRYTTPFSLGGLPAVSLPGELIGAPSGTGVQLAASQDCDPALLAYVAMLGEALSRDPA